MKGLPMKKRIIISALFLFSIIYSCTGPTGPAGKDGINGKDGGYDKQLRIDIESSICTGGELTRENLGTYKFDKRNFIGVDSIVFVGMVWAGDTNVYGKAELFNYDDGLTIANSTISAKYSSGNWEISQSVNCYNSLPNKEINIGVRIKGIAGHGICLDRTSLLLYRK
jgi:hypothetical protein